MEYEPRTPCDSGIDDTVGGRYDRFMNIFHFKRGFQVDCLMTFTILIRSGLVFCSSFIY